MTHLIKVTNTGSHEFADYYHGDSYKFLPDEPVNVPLDAMQHIFGVEFPADEVTLNSSAFRDLIFSRVATRWGWNSHIKAVLTENRKMLNQLKFTAVMMKMVELVAQEETLAPAREERKPGKFSKSKPESITEPDSEEEEVA